MATPRIADQIGRVLGGRYRLIAPIGTGASAHVYIGVDATLGRRVAVKVLHPALAGDESFLRRFRAEARVVAALRHPHIMQVYDWGEDDDGPYLVLEHLAGGSLRDLLDAGHRLSPSQVLQIGLEAARGLDHAHRRGLVHRDIKPANLLFDEEGRLAIADFGLARALAEAAWTEPAGAVLGTARYASPEQAKGSSLDGKSDVYALALTLVEAATGSVPFAADTTIGTLMARVDSALVVPPELGPLAPALAAAGAVDPAGRTDAGGLVRALDEAARSLPRPAPLPLSGPSEETIDLTRPSDDLTVIGSPGAKGTKRVFDVESDIEALGPTSPPSSGGRRWRRWLVVAVAALVVGLGGAFAAAEVTKPEHPVPDLANRSLDEARRLAARGDFEVRATEGPFYREDVEKGRILGQTPLAGDRLKEGETIRVQVSDGPSPRAVPDLSGKPRAEAQRLLEEKGLTMRAVEAYSETVPRDHVIDWRPRTGTAAKGSEVEVTLSRGREPKPLPAVAQRTYEEAAKLLADAGFSAKKEEAFDDKVEAGQVVATKPGEGALAEPGTEVIVVVSKGPEKVAVPSLRGLGEAEAAERLRAAGLRLGDRFGPPGRPVFDSSPTAGSMAAKGSSVDVYTR